MEKLTFKNIIDSLDDSFDPIKRSKLFDMLINEDTNDVAILGIRQFLIDNNFDHVALRSYLQENKSNYKKRKPLNTNYNVWLRVAAIFIGVSLLSYLFIFRQSNFHLTPYESVEQGLPVLMGENSKKDFADAMSRFKQKEYKESMKLLLDCSPSDTVTYYIGLCEYFEKEYNLSITNLKTIKSNSVFYQKAQFYSALAFVKQKKYKDAKLILGEISDPQLTKLTNELLANLPKD